jgi:uncharacterized membrane protein
MEQQETQPAQESEPRSSGDRKSSTAVDEPVLEGEIHDKHKPGKQRHELARVSFSGPLPPPEILQQYQQIQADFPERILRLTEGEAAHRREITRTALRWDGIETFLGQAFALVVCLASLLRSCFMCFLGHRYCSSFVGV